MLIWCLISIILIFLGLGSVAFVTLLERKLLGLSQVRLGPNKIYLGGLVQPIFDGIKLLMKEYFFILNSQIFIVMMGPALSLVFFILVWTWLIPWLGDFFTMKYSSIFFFGLLGVSAYSVILSGWSSVSSFSKLGSLRGILQSLSFEIVLIFVFFNILLLLKGFFLKAEKEVPFEVFVFFSILWLLMALMETNRAPFDLMEGESELISGFNIELGSVPFVFLFLSEYGMMIVFSGLWSFSFFGSVNSLMMFFLVLMLFCRSCFPRLRYDYMMTMMWLIILPVSFYYLLLNALLFYSLNNKV